MAIIKDPVLRAFCVGLSTLGALAMLGGVLASAGLISLSGYTWLRYGYWEWLDGYDALRALRWAPPHVDNWAGVNVIIDWVVGLPLAASATPAGMLVGWVLLLIAQDTERDALARQDALERQNRSHTID